MFLTARRIAEKCCSVVIAAYLIHFTDDGQAFCASIFVVKHANVVDTARKCGDGQAIRSTLHDGVLGASLVVRFAKRRRICHTFEVD
ncbi:MAG: hypothetical protein GY822_14060 [Deltaproteobacteria bacterium]|nr:hypothetical protein [Deltaproteobacteria bacterium]